MNATRIVTSITIYPYGRDGGRSVAAQIVMHACDALLMGLGLPANLEGKTNNECGLSYQLTPECPLLISSEGDNASVLNAKLRVVLTGKLKDGKYMTVYGVDYSLHSRELNFLEKKGLEALQIA